MVKDRQQLLRWFKRNPHWFWIWHLLIWRMLSLFLGGRSETCGRKHELAMNCSRCPAMVSLHISCSLGEQLHFWGGGMSDTAVRNRQWNCVERTASLILFDQNKLSKRHWYQCQTQSAPLLTNPGPCKQNWTPAKLSRSISELLIFDVIWARWETLCSLLHLIK